MKQEEIDLKKLREILTKKFLSSDCHQSNPYFSIRYIIVNRFCKTTFVIGCYHFPLYKTKLLFLPLMISLTEI